MIDRPIKAVLSDMYGTLLFEDGGMEYSYSQMAVHAGLDVDQFTDRAPSHVPRQSDRCST